MRAYLFFLLWLIPLSAFAQPKMHLLFQGGLNGNRFIYKERDITSDFLPGWEAGLGFRLRKDHLFGELDLQFVNYGLKLPFESETDTFSIDIRLKAFEVPMVVGYVPLVSPLVKVYLYTGMVHRFNLSERLRIDEFGVDERLRPKDLGLPGYHLMWRFGTAVDLAMLNFNLSWSVGVTNGLRENIRTNHHVLRFTTGLLF